MKYILSRQDARNNKIDRINSIVITNIFNPVCFLNWNF